MRRERPELPVLEELAVPDWFDEELDPEPEPEPEPVEYFVELPEFELGVFTSVPKSVQFEQTSSFAPSTLMVFGADVSAPHISH